MHEVLSLLQALATSLPIRMLRPLLSEVEAAPATHAFTKVRSGAATDVRPGVRHPATPSLAPPARMRARASHTCDCYKRSATAASSSSAPWRPLAPGPTRSLVTATTMTTATMTTSGPWLQQTLA